MERSSRPSPTRAPPAPRPRDRRSINEAVESAYPQNPNLIRGVSTGVGIKYFGSDASKPYPNPSDPRAARRPAYPAGATFPDGAAHAIPRYPTNIYYNVSTEAQEVDEYNTLYTPVAEGGKCVTTSTNTCETTPANFAEIVAEHRHEHVPARDGQRSRARTTSTRRT